MDNSRAFTGVGGRTHVIKVNIGCLCSRRGPEGVFMLTERAGWRTRWELKIREVECTATVVIY